MDIKPTREELEQRIRVLEEESSRVKHVEEELYAERQKLGERIKELKCLYDLTELIERPGIYLLALSFLAMSQSNPSSDSSFLYTLLNT